MIYSKIQLAQTVILLCKAKNIKHIVISPGSRSAPLTIGFTNDPFFNCYSIVDERSAAFFAMGIAQNIQEPVVLVCSSGSALLNYYPAVAEAYYSDIPLVVLSADRPEYLIGIGDGQTINQKNVYKNHILYSANLKLDLRQTPRYLNNDEPAIIKNLENKLERFLGLKQEQQEENVNDINTALNTAMFKRGPVHINVPFEEPLYETVAQPTVTPKVIDVKLKEAALESGALQLCVDDWNQADKKMVLVGVLHPNSIEQQWLEQLALDDSVVVFTETTSNLKHQEFFPCIDKIIAPLTDQDFKQLQPDILLTFGGMVVSKKIKSFLRKYQPKQHWHLDRNKANDTFFCLERHLKISPNDFFAHFFPKLTHYKKSQYKPYWKQVRKQRDQKHKTYLQDLPFSDLKVFETILRALPKGSNLHVGNSSAIRYTQLFNTQRAAKVFCNRGTSGIDGSTSTAIGYACADTQQTVFITGDLSFFYDSNALWNNYIPERFRIIVVNNQGGGIFRILPGHKNNANFEQYFETKHALTAVHLCHMFNLEYHKASDPISLSKQLESFYQSSGKPKLLEVFTPRTVNSEVLLRYFEFVK